MQYCSKTIVSNDFLKTTYNKSVFFVHWNSSFCHFTCFVWMRKRMAIWFHPQAYLYEQGTMHCISLLFLICFFCALRRRYSHICIYSPLFSTSYLRRIRTEKKINVCFYLDGEKINHHMCYYIINSNDQSKNILLCLIESICISSSKRITISRMVLEYRWFSIFLLLRLIYVANRVFWYWKNCWSLNTIITSLLKVIKSDSQINSKFRLRTRTENTMILETVIKSFQNHESDVSYSWIDTYE